jgi:hypothetical protein
MTNHDQAQIPPRLNITLMGDSVSEIVKLRAKMEMQLGVRLSIAEVVRHLVAKAQS